MPQTSAPPDRRAAQPRADAFMAADGRAITIWRWPEVSGRPCVHWAHATGFHARTYAALLADLAQVANVIAWDMRGHGASSEAGEPRTLRSWDTYYRDLCSLIDSLDGPVWLGGHSIGATCSAMAAARRPDKVKGLLLAEPVLLDRRERLALAAGKLLGQAHRFHLAAGARRRRPVFPSRDAAFAAYREKSAFRTWPDEWLAAYVEHGFVDIPDGVRLACDPDWESTTFAATEHKPWSMLRRVRCPLIALGAGHASTFPLSARHRMSRLLPQADIRTIPDTSHFLPMEKPGAVRDALSELLARP